MPRSVNPRTCPWCGTTRARVGWIVAHMMKCPKRPTRAEDERLDKEYEEREARSVHHMFATNPATQWAASDRLDAQKEQTNETEESRQ